jgi:alcohol dehydrogenase
MLLRMLAVGRIDPARFITHRFALDEMPGAYEVFSQPQQSGALKVVLTR